MEILIASTKNGARVGGRDAELGTIEPGKFADMLILRANPQQDIHAVFDIETIISNGRVYQWDALYNSLSR